MALASKLDWGIIYIDTTLPGHQLRRTLKKPDTFYKLARGPTDIYSRTQVEKCCDHHHQVHHLNMIQYLTIYKVTKFEQEDQPDGEIPEDDTYYSGRLDRNAGYNRRNLTSFIDYFGTRMRLPEDVTDSENVSFQRRVRFPLWRTYEASISEQEQFYYRHITLYIPSTDFVADKGPDRSWHKHFDHLRREGAFEEHLTDEYLEKLLEDEQIFDEEQDFQQGPQYNPPYNLDGALDMASDERLEIFNTIMSRPIGVYVIHGGSGV